MILEQHLHLYPYLGVTNRFEGCNDLTGSWYTSAAILQLPLSNSLTKLVFPPLLYGPAVWDDDTLQKLKFQPTIPSRLHCIEEVEGHFGARYLNCLVLMDQDSVVYWTVKTDVDLIVSMEELSIVWRDIAGLSEVKRLCEEIKDRSSSGQDRSFSSSSFFWRGMPGRSK